ncbi:MAG: hypothetical protein ACK5EK_11475 [Flavobacteriia bacterium]
MKKKHFRAGLLLAITTTVFTSFAQTTAKSTARSSETVITEQEGSRYKAQIPRSLNYSDYPVYEDTGNPSEDRILFEEKRIEWESAMGISALRIFTENEQELNEQYSLADEPTVKEFMRNVLSQPLPDNFPAPLYITKSGDAESAIQMIAANYPEFSGKKDRELVIAVRNNPALYVRMIMEFRAVRLLHKLN